MDTIDLTLYLVGDTEDEAREGLPFDSLDSAESYLSDNGGIIYRVTATIDFATMTKV